MSRCCSILLCRVAFNKACLLHKPFGKQHGEHNNIRRNLMLLQQLHLVCMPAKLNKKIEESSLHAHAESSDFSRVIDIVSESVAESNQIAQLKRELLIKTNAFNFLRYLNRHSMQQIILMHTN